MKLKMKERQEEGYDEVEEFEEVEDRRRKLKKGNMKKVRRCFTKKMS